MAAALTRSAERPKSGADFFGEQLRLLSRREVAALFRLVVVNELGVGPFGHGVPDVLAVRGWVMVMSPPMKRVKRLPGAQVRFTIGLLP